MVLLVSFITLKEVVERWCDSWDGQTCYLWKSQIKSLKKSQSVKIFGCVRFYKYFFTEYFVHTFAIRDIVPYISRKPKLLKWNKFWFFLNKILVVILLYMLHKYYVLKSFCADFKEYILIIYLLYILYDINTSYLYE